jgi:pilus assembly protein CpaC
MSFITRLFVLVCSTAFVAASLGVAAEPILRTNASAAARGPQLFASGTNVVIIAASPEVQGSARVAKKPVPPPASTNVVVTANSVSQTKPPPVVEALATNTVIAIKAPAAVPAANVVVAAKISPPTISEAPSATVPGTNAVAVASPTVKTSAPMAIVSSGLTASAIGLIATAQPIMQTNTLVVGEAKLVPASGSNIVVPAEGVIRVIPAGPGKVVISAEQEGHTDMMVLNEDSQITEHYAIIVVKKQHTTEKATYEASLEDFRQVVKKIVGDHQVQFEMVVGPRISFNGTNLVAQPHPVLFIHGEAKDEIEANAIRSVASRFYGQGDFGSTSQQVTSNGSYNGAPATTNTVQNTSLSNDPNIVDQMTIRSHHQIRIRVQVAEVNIEALKQKGISYSSSVAGTLSMGAIGVYPGNAVPSASLGISSITATLLTLVRDSYARLLSEPTLVAKSGQEASFLAGGQIIQQVILNNSLTQQNTTYGVRMTIKPTVDRADHIDTDIYTEVSDIPEILSSGEINIRSRNSTTKLRLNNRDTFILGGLLQNNFRNDIRKVPWMGQVPILGALFRSKDWQSGQTELLFFITPEIVGDDLKADTDRNITTPAMRQWHKVDGHKDMLADPNSHAGPDNDVHDLLGLPADRMHSEQLKQAPAVPDTAPARGASR